MILSMTIPLRLDYVRKRIAQVAKQAQLNPDDITLLAVTKTRTVEEIELAIQAGQVCFGENYVQEALPKITTLKKRKIEWHFIGSIQCNKTKSIAENFSWVQSIDQEKIVPRLAYQRPPHFPPLNICIQVNIDQAPTKQGVYPENVLSLAKKISSYKRLKLRGLMAIPDPETKIEKTLEKFQRLHTLYEQLDQQGFALDTLSMGMSQDFELAIQAGATMVRVGTDIFGNR